MGDKTIMDGDIKKLLDDRKTELDAVQEQEQRQMAEAAYKTIKTLEEMVMSLQGQIRKKEDKVTEMRNEMMRQKELDCYEIQRLNEQLAGEGKQALGKLLKLAQEPDENLHINITSSHAKISLMSQHEIERALFDKDNLIKQLKVKLAGLDKEKDVNYKKINALRKDLDRANYELLQESNKNEQAFVKRELNSTKKLLERKDGELKKMKEAIQNLKKDIVKYSAMNVKQEEDLKHKDVNSNAFQTEKERKLREAAKRVTDLAEDNRKLKETLRKFENTKLAKEKVNKEEAAAAENVQKKLIESMGKAREQVQKLEQQNKLVNSDFLFFFVSCFLFF